jgi:steroid delta-isomerase-like uncharacterized protein
MSSDNKALIRQWFDEVWNTGRESAIDELMANGGLVHGLGEDLVGPAGFKPFHRAFRDAFPDMIVHLDQVIAEGDTVAARWTATGTHRGDGLGFAATGRPVSFTGMVFARIADGKLVEGWNSMDQLGMMQQLGIVDRPA